MYLTLALVLAFSILPLWLWRPSRKLLIPVLAIFAIKIYTLLDLINGTKSVCHDSLGLQFVFAIIRDWQVSQVAMDWNPYLTAGQPFAVSTNFMFWVPVIVLARLVAFLQIELTSLQFSHMIYLYLTFQICVGTVMLLQLLYRNKVISLFGAVAIILGGFFTESASGPNGLELITFVPYLLFFLVYFLRYKNWFALAMFSLFLGDTFNHYNPASLAIFVTIFLIILSLTPGQSFRKAFQGVYAKPLRLAGCVMLLLVAFAPGIYGFMEMRDYVSPTREFSQYGKVSATNWGTQPGMEAELKYYAMLFDRNYFNPRVPTPGQYAYYLGIIPCFLMSFAFRPILKNPVVRALALTMIIFTVLSLGKGTPVWGWFLDHVPLFNLIRHPATFSPWVSLLCIIVSMAGLRELLNRRISFVYKFGVLVVLGCVTYKIHATDYWFVGSFVLFVLATVAVHIASARKYYHLFLIPLFIISASDTSYYSYIKANKSLCAYKSYPVQAMSYPTDWRSTCESCKVFLPLDFWPVVDKQIVWSHPDSNYGYMMPKEFVEFQNGLKAKGVFYGKTFYLLPEMKKWNEFYEEIFRPQPSSDAGVVEVSGNEGSGKMIRRQEAIAPLRVDTSGSVVALDSKNPNHISVVTQSDHEGYLLRLETYHKGWKAYVDDVETVIEKVYPVFQIIRVPAGEHRVRFEFHSAYPLLIRIATLFVVAGWLLTLGWLWHNGRWILNTPYFLFLGLAIILLVCTLPQPKNTDDVDLLELRDGKRQYVSNVEYKQLPINNEFDSHYFGNIDVADVSVKNLFDQNEKTAWVTPDINGVDGWIIRRFDKPFRLQSIYMKTQSSETAPTGFKVSGSMDGEHWDIIGDFNHVDWANGESGKLFTMSSNTRFYSYYKLSDFYNETPSWHMISQVLVLFRNPDEATSHLDIFGSFDSNHWKLIESFDDIKWDIDNNGEKYHYFIVHTHERLPRFGVAGTSVSIEIIRHNGFYTDNFSHRHSSRMIISELVFGKASHL